MSEVVNPRKVLKNVIGRMRFSAGCWTVIAICQIIVGIPAILFFGYGISMIGCGIWNLVASNNERKSANYFEKYPMSIYPWFEDRLNSIAIFLCVNLIFGGVIGVIGAVYDFILRDYVMKHKAELEMAQYQMANEG